MLRRKGTNRFAAGSKGRGIYTSKLREYPHRLNFYLTPPPREVTLEEFEGFALDRLNVLRAIEQATLRNKDLKVEILKAVQEYLPLHSNTSKHDHLFEERRKDHISHYVLRMAYCRSKELRNWFIKQECQLFKYRFDQETMEEKKLFLDSLKLNWRIVTMEEKEKMRKELTRCSKPKKGVLVPDYIASETFFEVDFEKVPTMLRRRNLYVKKGKAYVPLSDQVNIAMREYKIHLEQALDAISKVMPRLEEDGRLRPILSNVEKQYAGRGFDNVVGSAAGTVNASQIDSLVQKHAPLCMRNLSDSLKHDKHLKHMGRLQYGLFIKGMGLSVEEALIFWKTKFTAINDDKFKKEYAYGIRYNYGLEGKRVNFNPYSCLKIITQNPPNAGENHGCPFKHFSPANLEARLLNDRISRSNVDQIVALAKQKHYQLACTKHFEVTHPQNKEKIETIEHPIHYYEASKKLDKDVASSSTQLIEESMEIDD